MKYKYVIVGAGIAGSTAAFEIRKHSQDPILLLGNEGLPLYNRILLPHLLKGEFEESRVFIKKIEDYRDHGIDYRPDAHVTALDLSKRKVISPGLEVEFEKLLIAAGTTPNPIDLGVRPVYQMQSLEDARNIERALSEAESAAVIGGGFIALEFMGVLAKRGIKTRAYLRETSFFHNFFDATCDQILSEHLTSLGVEINRSAKIIDEAIMKDVDFVGVGVGVRRNLRIAKAAGLKTAKGILTDQYLETATSGIFAAGDVAEYNAANGINRTFGNWTNALAQGRRAGLNMLGGIEPFSNLPNYSTSAVGINISTFGITDIRESDQTIGRGDAEEKSYARFFIRQGQVIGAVLINRLSEAAVVSSLIKDKVKIDQKLLADTGTKIENIR